MRRFRAALLVLALVSLAVANPAPKEKDKAGPGRLLTGKVLDRHDNPLIDAVVYLSDTRTRAVKTYIVGPDGAYHFPELSANTDYDVYALYKSQKSDTKT